MLHRTKNKSHSRIRRHLGLQSLENRCLFATNIISTIDVVDQPLAEEVAIETHLTTQDLDWATMDKISARDTESPVPGSLHGMRERVGSQFAGGADESNDQADDSTGDDDTVPVPGSLHGMRERVGSQFAGGADKSNDKRPAWSWHFLNSGDNGLIL